MRTEYSCTSSRRAGYGSADTSTATAYRRSGRRLSRLEGRKQTTGNASREDRGSPHSGDHHRLLKTIQVFSINDRGRNRGGGHRCSHGRNLVIRAKATTFAPCAQSRHNKVRCFAVGSKKGRNSDDPMGRGKCG